MTFVGGKSLTGIRPMKYQIEAMRATDWAQIRAVYLEGIATGQATFQTEAPAWAEWDAGHLSTPRLVARAAGSVLGWAALSPSSKRACYAGVAEVSIYIAAAARGQGVGNALMAALIAAAEEQGLWTLWSSIFPENAASLRLHLRHGFREVGRRERIAQLHGVWRDTVILERRSRKVGLD
jgi:L-amino acid N-acyltransferase YncA